MMMRHIFAAFLALMLGLTSQSMAVARGASAATGQLVLCTGTGPVAIYIDAQGQPTSAPHICPDSALNVIVAGVAASVVAPVRMILFSLPVALTARATPTSPHPAPPSRAPPVSV